jgi:hypothetical protein
MQTTQKVIEEITNLQELQKFLTNNHTKTDFEKQDLVALTRKIFELAKIQEKQSMIFDQAKIIRLGEIIGSPDDYSESNNKLPPVLEWNINNQYNNISELTDQLLQAKLEDLDQATINKYLVNIIFLESQKNQKDLETLAIYRDDLKALYEVVSNDELQKNPINKKAATENIRRKLEEIERERWPLWKKSLELAGQVLLPLYGRKASDNDISDFDSEKRKEKKDAKSFISKKNLLTLVGGVALGAIAIVASSTSFGLVPALALGYGVFRLSVPAVNFILNRKERNNSRRASNQRAVKNHLFEVKSEYINVLAMEKNKIQKNSRLGFFGSGIVGIIGGTIIIMTGGTALLPLAIFTGSSLFGMGSIISKGYEKFANYRAKKTIVAKQIKDSTAFPDNNNGGLDLKLLEKISGKKFFKSESLTSDEAKKLNEFLQKFGFTNNLFQSGKKADANALKSLDYAITMNEKLQRTSELKNLYKDYHQNGQLKLEDFKKALEAAKEAANLKKYYLIFGPKTITSAFDVATGKATKTASIIMDKKSPNFIKDAITVTQSEKPEMDQQKLKELAKGIGFTEVSDENERKRRKATEGLVRSAGKANQKGGQKL